jgi:hypothetical protein
MPKDIFRNLKKVRVVGQELRISRQAAALGICRSGWTLMPARW